MAHVVLHRWFWSVDSILGIMDYLQLAGPAKGLFEILYVQSMDNTVFNKLTSLIV